MNTPQGAAWRRPGGQLCTRTEQPDNNTTKTMSTTTLDPSPATTLGTGLVLVRTNKRTGTKEILRGSSVADPKRALAWAGWYARHEKRKGPVTVVPHSRIKVEDGVVSIL